MTLQDLKDLQHVLNHYLLLSEKKFKNEPIRVLAKRLAEKVERKLLEK